MSCFFSSRVKVKYFGKASHAAAFPWEGVNALDAAVTCYQTISNLRQQMKPTWRVHGAFSTLSSRHHGVRHVYSRNTIFQLKKFLPGNIIGNDRDINQLDNVLFTRNMNIVVLHYSCLSNSMSKTQCLNARAMWRLFLVR